MPCCHNRILSLVTTVLVGLSGLPALSEAAEFHVAPSGNDANPGSLAAPFATVAGARDHIRAIRKAEMFPTDGVTVTIHAGTYELSEPLAFISEDSGTADAPIIYRAAGGDEVRLYAGRMLTGMTRVTNQAVLDRVDETARAHLQQIDIKVQGVTDYGEMSGGFGKKGSPGLEFFIDDIPMVLARYPNIGFIPITEALGQTKKDVRGNKGCVEGVFAYDDDRPARWLQEKDAWVQGYWFWDWAEERQRVAAIDTAKRILTVSPPHHTFGYRKGQWFYGFNLLCEIDEPGEWYLDRAAGILYFWPPDGAPGGRAMVSLCKYAVTLTGASHLVLRGFIVEGARDHAIVVKDCTAVQVQACTVRNAGAWAVEVTGGTGVRVVGCDITGTGDGGVSLSGGDRKTLTPAGHVAENNNIHDYSRWNRVYRAGIKLEGVGNVARHNLIHHAPHQAIGFAGNDHVMEFNEIHNVCEESNDAGAIYAWCDWAARGNVFRFNYVHHCYGHNERSCAGIYLDDNWSACHIHGNIFHDVPKAVMLGGGRDHIVENNLFVNCKPPMHIDARGLNWRKYGKAELTKSLQQWPYKDEPWRSKYPKLVTILDDDPMAPAGIIIRRNIYWQGWRWDSGFYNNVQAYLTVADNLTETDPLFMAPEKGDFRFKDGSPAAGIGFEPIPLDRMGIYRDELRASWPVTHPVRVAELDVPEPKPSPPPTPHPTAPLSVGKTVPPPVIDGRLTVGEWPNAAVPMRETPERTAIQGPGCSAWMVHDGTTLYIAISVPTAKPDALDRSTAWGTCDGAEICFRIHDAKSPGPTYVVHSFLTGTVDSVTDGGARTESAAALGQAVRYTVTIGPDAWTAEWAIPLAAAGIVYQPGLVLGFNLGVHRNETNEWIAWTGTLGPNWQLSGAGRIVLE